MLGLFLKQVAGWKFKTSSNTDSGTGVFLKILSNFWEDLLHKHLETAASKG